MSLEVIKGVSFPFRINSEGRVMLSKVDPLSSQHIDESIKQILLTRVGERLMNPAFGSRVLDLVFQANNSSMDAIIRSDIILA
jgi:phage baseplate assembly protein W